MIDRNTCYLAFAIGLTIVLIYLICICRENYNSIEIGSDPADLYQTLYGEKSSGDMSQSELNEAETGVTQSSINNMFKTETLLPRGYKQNTAISMYQYPLSHIIR